MIGGRDAAPIGFLGLGIMGLPMATNLLRAGLPVHAWNRSRPALDRLMGLGATAADSVADFFESTDVVIMMLSSEEAIDRTLGRTGAGLPEFVAGRVLVNMGTVSPEFSEALARDVATAGGRFVEAPVSGSRVPAEAGQLVAMIAGQPDALALVRPLLDPLCSSITDCGPVPNGLRMKLAANVFLLAVVTGLAEAFAFAGELGLDPETLRAVFDAGQMSSPISRVKTAKLVSEDWSPQAAIQDVLMNARLIVDAADRVGAPVPMSRLSRELYEAAAARGDGALDMVAVARTLASYRAIT